MARRYRSQEINFVIMDMNTIDLGEQEKNPGGPIFRVSHSSFRKERSDI